MNTVIINNETTEVKTVATSIGGICFTMENIAIQDAVDKFSGATELSFAEDDVVYGIYTGISFKSATVDAEGVVTVNFHIKDETEKRIEELEKKCAELEKTQTAQNEQNAEQDEILAGILFGEEVTENE